jgi:hypothetical protein
LPDKCKRTQPKPPPKPDTSFIEALERGKQAYRSRLPKNINLWTPKTANETDPMPYWQPQEGEGYETIQCQHAGCEGSGYFVFSQSHKQRYLKYGNSMPKTCYPCKVWMFQHQSLLGIQGNCEVCEQYVVVPSNLWIGYHKFKGTPQFSEFCHACYKSQRHEKLHELKHGKIDEKYKDRGYVGLILTELDDKYSQKKDFQMALKTFITKEKSANLPDLIEISQSSFATSSQEHEYHTRDRLSKVYSRSTSESRSDHIKRHLDHFPEVQGNVNDLIQFLHRSKDDRDRNRYIDIPQSNNRIMRCDCKLFTVTIYDTVTGFVVTAYKPKDEKKPKLPIIIHFLNYLSSKYIVKEIILK